VRQNRTNAGCVGPSLDQQRVTISRYADCFCPWNRRRFAWCNEERLHIGEVDHSGWVVVATLIVLCLSGQAAKLSNWDWNRMIPDFLLLFRLLNKINKGSIYSHEAVKDYGPGAPSDSHCPSPEDLERGELQIPKESGFVCVTFHERA
jgi:hypothetical protein